jgi:hypothetical protein
LKTIKPNESETIAVVKPQPHNMGKIIMRFVALLGIAVLLLAFAWSR